MNEILKKSRFVPAMSVPLIKSLPTSLSALFHESPIYDPCSCEEQCERISILGKARRIVIT